MAYSVEVVRQIWDDDDGEHFDVGPDRDGLNLVEIRCYNPDGKIVERLSCPAEQARLVARAMLLCADEVDPANAKES